MTLRYLNFVVNAGQNIPDDTLAKIIDDNHSCWGMSYADDGEINVQVSNDMPTVSDVKEMRAFAPKEALFSFGSSVLEVPVASMQPFPVLFTPGVETKPLLMATIAGEFSKYSNPESDSSAEFNVRSRLLIPKFTKMLKMLKGNLPELLAELEDDVTAEELLNSADANSDVSITLLAANGWLRTYARGEKKKTLPWGFISSLPEDNNVHGPQKPTSASATARKLTLQEKIALKRAGGILPTAISTVEEGKKLITEPTPSSVPSMPAPAPVEKKVAEPISDRMADEYEYVMEGPPATMVHKHPIRDWYTKNWVDENGMLVGKPPEGYMKQRPKIRIKRLKSKPVMSMPVKADKVEAKGVVAKSFDALKDLVSGNGDKKVVETVASSAVAQPVLPTISMGQEARVREELLMDKSVKKFTGLTQEEINDPTQLKSQTEIKFPTFAARFSPHVKSLADTVNWTPEVYLRLIRDYPEAAVLLMIDYKANWVNVCQKTKTPLFQEPPAQTTQKAHNM